MSAPTSTARTSKSHRGTQGSKYEQNRVFVLNDPNAPRLSPALAVEIGLNESILFLQLEFWISISDNVREERKWVYKSVRDLRATFPFWGLATINRALHSLEKKQGLITVDNFNKVAYDRTRWFAINFENTKKLKSLRVEEPHAGPFQNGTGSAQNGTGSAQNGTRSAQNGTTIQETTPETTQRHTPIAPSGGGRVCDSRSRAKAEKEPPLPSPNLPLGELYQTARAFLSNERCGWFAKRAPGFDVDEVTALWLGNNEDERIPAHDLEKRWRRFVRAFAYNHRNDPRKSGPVQTPKRYNPGEGYTQEMLEAAAERNRAMYAKRRGEHVPS